MFQATPKNQGSHIGYTSTKSHTEKFMKLLLKLEQTELLIRLLLVIAEELTADENHLLHKLSIPKENLQKSVI